MHYFVWYAKRNIFTNYKKIVIVFRNHSNQKIVKFLKKLVFRGFKKMIDLIQAILMAILQGIIEWLPISSEGQLTLIFINIYEIPELEAVTLALFLHLGTMVSVLWKFRQEFYQIINKNEPITRILLFVTFGTAITAIPLVILLKNFWIDISYLFPIPTDILFTIIIGLMLIFTGFILSKQPEQGIREISSLTYKEVFILGMIQGVAALPGISRSGMTLTFLLIIGLGQRDALRTSFIISVPAVLGATVLEYLLSGFYLSSSNLIIGTVSFPYILVILTIFISALIGLVTMNTLLSLKNIEYNKFCIGFGLLTIFIAILTLLVSNLT